MNFSLFLINTLQWINRNTGQFMFGDHLIAFSTSVENQTGMKWTKEKIRAASLWVMTERSTVTTPNLEKSSRDIEHLRQSNDNKNSDQSKNAILLKNLHNKLQRKQKKRKRKNSKTDGDSNLYQLEKYSYNHITNDNHIIENNRNEDTTKKTNSINLVGSSMYNRDGIKDLKANVTLWIFRIREQLMMEMDSKDMDDKVFFKFYEYLAYLNFISHFSISTKQPNLLHQKLLIRSIQVGKK